MRLKTLFWWIACLGILALFGILLGLRSYQVFAREDLVAVVRCEGFPKGSPYQFKLEFTPVSRGFSTLPQRFLMHGDQWTIGGEILKWHPWLNLMGIKSCHKLTRLSSRYLKAQEELAKPKSVYELGGGTSLFWQWLYRAQSWIPFVEAVYGNSTYTMAQPDTQWGVYVTLSGYLVRPLKR